MGFEPMRDKPNGLAGHHLKTTRSRRHSLSAVFERMVANPTGHIYILTSAGSQAVPFSGNCDNKTIIVIE